MNYCSYGRFQGAWLGSMIGAALTNRDDRSDYAKIIEYRGHDWVETRDAIAHYIIATQEVENKHICQQLTSLLWNPTGDRNCRLSIDPHSNLLLSLLPLIIFSENDRNTYIEIIAQCNFKSENALKIEQDVLIWAYLLTLAFKNQFKENSNVSMMIEQVLGGVEEKTASVVEKLSIVGEALKCGSSLQDLSEKLDRIDHQNAAHTQAIALSFYCFASTPRNFMLCVQRASNLPHSLSASITALTATISGAYNGVARIPKNWIAAAYDNPSYQQAQKTIEQLYKTWLGTYHSNTNQLLYDPDTDAVAFPGIIQPRSTLKIISQKSSSSVVSEP